MKYGIINVGGVGGYYGGSLTRIGKVMHSLIHNYYEYVAEHELRVGSWDVVFFVASCQE